LRSRQEEEMEQVQDPIETAMENLGQRQYYPRKSNETSTTSIPSPLLNRRPMIAVDSTPNEIAGTDLDAFKSVIRAYRGVPEDVGWDKYAASITDVSKREMVRRIMKECRRQGYVNPRVYDEKLYFDRIVRHKSEGRKEPIDLCSLCSRDCTIREDIDQGKTKWEHMRDPRYEEPKKCWEVKP
jgi:hypothetical protein